MKKLLGIVFLGLLWSNLFFSSLIADFHSTENLKKKYIFEHCKSVDYGDDPLAIIYTLDTSRRYFVEDITKLKTKFFYYIDPLSIKDGVVPIGDLMKHLSEGHEDYINLVHFFVDNLNIDINTANIKTGESIIKMSLKKSAPPEVKKTIKEAIKQGFKMKDKKKCVVK